MSRAPLGKISRVIGEQFSPPSDQNVVNPDGSVLIDNRTASITGEVALHIVTALRQSIFALLTITSLAGLPANAADAPADMQAISGAVQSTPAETATKNVLALNTAMFGLYDAAGRVF